MKMIFLIISLFTTAALWHVNSQITTTGGNTLIIPIPDNDTNGAIHQVDISTIPIGAEIINIELDIAINHTYVGDLMSTITSPGQENIWLMIRPGRDDVNNAGNGHGANLDTAFPITFKDTSVNPAEEMGGTLTTSQTICNKDGMCDYLPGSDITTETLADLANSINTNNSNPNGVWEIWVGDFAQADSGVFFVPELRVTYNPPLGIEDNISSNKISFHPNPANNYIQFETYEVITAIKIYNLLGQQVMQLDTPIESNEKIDISSLQAGTYITTITTESSAQTLKFIKN